MDETPPQAPIVYSYRFSRTAVLDAATVLEGINAMKKCVMFTSAALLLAAGLVSCTESSDSMTAEDRATRDGRREVQETRAPPGPPNASMIQDDAVPAGGDAGGGD